MQVRINGIGLTVLLLCVCGVNVDTVFSKFGRWLGEGDADTSRSLPVRARSVDAPHWHGFFLLFVVFGGWLSHLLRAAFASLAL